MILFGYGRTWGLAPTFLTGYIKHASSVYKAAKLLVVAIIILMGLSRNGVYNTVYLIVCIYIHTYIHIYIYIHTYIYIYINSE